MLNKIDSKRLLSEIEELSQIGRTPDGGVSRSALSEADVQGRAWFKAKAEATGLEVTQDGAGNQSASWRYPEDRKTLLIGSHLDSVPNGGKFDGALGVLTALEVVRRLKEVSGDIRPQINLEVINFTDEESAHIALMGSRALAGTLSAADFDNPRSDPTILQAGMERLGLTRESILNAKRDPSTIAAFLEIHIEQGTRLEEAGIDIGVVTSIVGIRSLWLTFRGQAAHAGTTPMNKRHDALWGATSFIQQARDLVTAQFSPGVVNVGQLLVQPGAFNIVPAEARLALEFRHGTEAQLDTMQEALLNLAHESAQQFGLELAIEQSGSAPASMMDERVVQAVESAAEKLGLKHTRLLSFAGHDTMSMSKIVPSAMYFVPSVNGISHNPKEFTKPEDVINGANVFLHAVLNLMEQFG